MFVFGVFLRLLRNCESYSSRLCFGSGRIGSTLFSRKLNHFSGNFTIITSKVLLFSPLKSWCSSSCCSTSRQFIILPLRSIPSTCIEPGARSPNSRYSRLLIIRHVRYFAGLLEIPDYRATSPTIVKR